MSWNGDPRGRLEEKYRGQRLVEIEPEDLAESREAGQLAAVEYAIQAGQLLVVVEPTQDAVVEDTGDRRTRLAFHEVAVIPHRAVDKIRSFDQQQFLARSDVAEEMDTTLGQIDTRN